MKKRLRTYCDLIKYHQKHTKAFARHDLAVFEAMVNRCQKHSKEKILNKRILDIGCGNRFPFTLLFSNLGNQITGIDMEVVGNGFKKYFKMIRINGGERAAKSLFRKLFFDPSYYNALQKDWGSKLNKKNLDLKIADATALPFSDNYFDLVISNAVLEHIDNVEKAVSEVKRVLKPNGICHIEIHLFTSISGGHNLGWHDPDYNPPKDIPPWDHLKQNLFPSHVYLNQFREHQYREIFENQFTILDWIAERYEGEKFLTPQIEKELSQYSREELLKRSIVVIGRKL